MAAFNLGVALSGVGAGDATAAGAALRSLSRAARVGLIALDEAPLGWHVGQHLRSRSPVMEDLNERDGAA